MDVEPSHDRPVLATALPVAATVLLHAAVCTAVINVVKPDVPDLVPYWMMAVLGPSLTWAALALGRAAVWRRTSAFWLGGSAGIVVVLTFMTSLVLFLGPIFLRGVPLALIYSSWILLACAMGVAVFLRLVGMQIDSPIDADSERPAPARSSSEAEASQSDRV